MSPLPNTPTPAVSTEAPSSHRYKQHLSPGFNCRPRHAPMTLLCFRLSHLALLCPEHLIVQACVVYVEACAHRTDGDCLFEIIERTRNWINLFPQITLGLRFQFHCDLICLYTVPIQYTLIVKYNVCIIEYYSKIVAIAIVPRPNEISFEMLVFKIENVKSNGPGPCSTLFSLKHLTMIVKVLIKKSLNYLLGFFVIHCLYTTPLFCSTFLYIYTATWYFTLSSNSLDVWLFQYLSRSIPN